MNLEGVDIFQAYTISGTILQRLPKFFPQLHIRHTAAQTRRVSAAQIEPNPRMLWR